MSGIVMISSPVKMVVKVRCTRRERGGITGENAASVPRHVVRHVMRSGPDLRVKTRRSPEDPG